jgi:hypothetical protein
MKRLKCICIGLLCLACNGIAMAQADQPGGKAVDAPTAASTPGPAADNQILSAQKERQALRDLFSPLETIVVATADAMPADKYSFVPSNGEFKGVRTFGQQVKHLAACNYILAAAALGEDPPADAGDESGPETVRTKAEIIDYLNGSFASLGKAIDAIGNTEIPVKASPISPLQADSVTRLALIEEALIHTFDHYGQMVEYLRMNGVVPPASRP